MDGSQRFVLQRRAGFAYRGLVIALVLLAGLPAIGWAVLSNGWYWSSSGGNGPMMHEVTAEEFIHDVTERGNLESAQNTDITSKVKSTSGGGYGGTPILEIVPEGTIIKLQDCLPEGVQITYRDLQRLEEYQGNISQDEAAEAGPKEDGKPKEDGDPEETVEQLPGAEEAAVSVPVRAEPDLPSISPEELSKKLLLVKFDSSSPETQLLQQQIVCANSRAAVVQADNEVEVAEIARSEYLEGTHQEELLGIEIQIKEAVIELSQATQYLEFSQRLARKGFITKQQLQDDQTRVTKAQNALDLAKKKLAVLETFKKKKMGKQLQADILTAKAKLEAAEASLQLDEERLLEIEEQIAYCTIFATVPGQVVYANIHGHRGHDEVVIEAGTPIRENQVIIRLPDPTQMQVNAKINESRIALVEEGMEAEVRLDAFPKVVLRGVVETVSDYPAPTSWFRGDIKEYETIIKILDQEIALPEGETLRPGLTAEVSIRVRQIAEAIQVPVQAVIEHGARHYCVFYEDGGFRKHEVTIGPSNDKFVIITKGLDVGQKVVLNAAAYREQIDLPELPPDQQKPPGAASGQTRQGKMAGKADGPSARKPPNPVEQFKRLDSDGDDKLAGAELQAMPREFPAATVDADGDGAISRSEFLSAVRRRLQQSSGGGPRPEMPQ